MSYQLSGADRDAITAFVHGEQVAAALSYVEKLVQRALDNQAPIVTAQPEEEPTDGH